MTSCDKFKYNLFFSCDHVTLLCQLRQLKVVDVHKFLLRGIIRSEKNSLEYIVPQSLRVRHFLDKTVQSGR